MRRLQVGSEFFEAERITMSDGNIIGTSGGIEVFRFSGVNFDKFTIEDGKDYDADDNSVRIAELEGAVMELVSLLASLGV